MTTIWVDGTVAAGERAQVSALDHGLTVGDGVFETAKVVDGRPFALTRHLRRLARSAGILALDPPDGELIREAVDKVLAAEGPLPFGRLRITLTGGAGPMGSDRGDASPSLIVAAQPAAPWADGTAVITVPWPRNERSAIAGAKTTSYAENVVALRAAKAAGASEALMPNTRGELCEGTGSNVVLVLDGELVTPPLKSGCLAGITRELLLEWGLAAGLPVAERDLTLGDLARAEDVLLTSSTRDVQPVRWLDGVEVAGSEAGRAAVALFAARAAETVDP